MHAAMSLAMPMLMFSLASCSTTTNLSNSLPKTEVAILRYDAGWKLFGPDFKITMVDYHRIAWGTYPFEVKLPRGKHTITATYSCQTSTPAYDGKRIMVTTYSGQPVSETFYFEGGHTYKIDVTNFMSRWDFDVNDVTHRSN